MSNGRKAVADGLLRGLPAPFRLHVGRVKLNSYARPVNQRRRSLTHVHGSSTISVAGYPSSPTRVSAETSFVYWVLQIIVWSAYCLMHISGEVFFAMMPWSKAVTVWGAVGAAHVSCTHLLRGLAKRHNWLMLAPAALLTRVIVGVLLISLACYLVTIASSVAVYGSPVTPVMDALYRMLPPRTRLVDQFFSSLILNVLWVAIYFGLAMQRHRYRAELRQVQLHEAWQAAELRLLKSQLNPHFLFNALNSVRALIADEPGRAQEAVTQLARTLRYALASGDEDLVTLTRELEMVNDYLAIESLRLADRLEVVREIEPAASTMRIPIMLVQMLVENAIKHGIAALKRGGTLRIHARLAGSELIIQIVNPRPTGEIAEARTDGVGLKNSSERLRLLFGPAAKLHLDLSVSGLATAEIRIPT
jgi:sensor histidine kinase YesM